MAIEFKLPELSEGVESADVAEILVREGDTIEPGQVVIEVETEKAVADIECPHGGRIETVHVSEGDSVSVGSVLLTIAEAEPSEARRRERPPEVPEAKHAEREPATAESEAAEEPPPSRERQHPHEKADVEPAHAGEAVEDPDAPKVAAPASTALARSTDGRERPPAPAAPSTRRLARHLGVDLHKIKGSGPGGRITADDVQAYVRGLTAAKTPVDVSHPMAGSELPDFSALGPVTRQPLNKIARTSAAHLSLCWRLIPHVTQHDLADITELEAARKRYMQTAGKNGPKLTMTAIVIKAAVAALREHPQFNSSLDTAANELILKGYYHIGVAVDTDNGLLVPVIRDADRKSILELAAELTDLAERARNRRLALDDMQGGTFTITNLGGIGGTAFTPIVNYPEVAILGLSRSRTELRMFDGQVNERLLLPLSLSYDHRVVNGADAARFIVKLSQCLSDYMHLLVES
ncbi:MAG TPA: 2-oxo acid dehydrogenase subunit E2 [Planctomycetaceae bacterium]|nr:2-oxo acid dehydrogenase subunit E2 [Planctomycetaceae bacterium]